MRRKEGFLWFIGLSLAFPQALPASDAEAAAVLQTALEAHGGVDAIGGAPDAWFTGEALTVRGEVVETYRFVTRTRGVDRMRTEVRGPKFEQLWVTDGEAGWVVVNGEKRPLFAHRTANRLIEANPVLGLLGAFAADRLEVAYEGVAEREGATVHRVTALLRDPKTERVSVNRTLDTRLDVAIDERTGLIAALAVRRVGSDPEADRGVDEYAYSDYRWADGLAVPFRVTHRRGDRFVKELRLEDFALMTHGAIFVEP